MIRKILFRLFMLVMCAICVLGACMIYTTMHMDEGKKIYAVDASTMREIQSRLRAWGYYDGAVNGVMDNATIEAIKYFQRVNGLTVSGRLDSATAEAIGVYIGTQSSNDLYLLAKCIHAEARGESYIGKVAVGAVILNRVESPEFPNTVYGVIYQPWAFTAVQDGQINLEPDNEAYNAASDALNGWDPTYGALFYYNPAVATSSWIFNRKVVTQIGKHVFAI